MFYNACVRGEEKENMQMHVFSDSSSGQAGQKQKPPVPRAPPVSGGTKIKSDLSSLRAVVS